MPKINFTALETFRLIHGARAYLVEMEKAIPAAEQRERREFEKLAHQQKWDWEEYDIQRQEIEGTYHYSMPEVLSYSLITYLHTIVEVRLLAFARRIRKEAKIALKINEIFGSPIERTKLFLTKLGRLAVAEDPGWASLRDLAFLRNIIVHRQGTQGSDQKIQQKIQELVKRYPDKLRLSGKGDAETSQIVISPALCRHFLDEIEGFFRRVFSAAGF